MDFKVWVHFAVGLVFSIWVLNFSTIIFSSIHIYLGLFGLFSILFFFFVQKLSSIILINIFRDLINVYELLSVIFYANFFNFLVFTV